MHFEQLLSALGLETRLDLREAVAQGGCTIDFDGKLQVTVESADDGRSAHLHAVVATAPVAEVRAAAFGVLLQLHTLGLATDGAYFGFDPARDAVLLFRTLPLETLNTASALAGVESFVNQLGRWRSQLPAVFAQGAADAPAGAIGTGFGTGQRV